MRTTLPVAVARRRRRALAPAHLAVRAPHAKLGLMRLAALQQALHADLKALPVLRDDQDLEMLGRDDEFAGHHAVDLVLAFVPDDLSVGQVPVPRSHVAGREREAAPLLAFQQPQGRGFQLGGALRDAPLQLRVEQLELPVLAVELGEDADLGAQHLRHHRHRHVVDRAHLVAAQMIDLGEMNRRDEDHRDLLEARMLADHRRKLEAVQLRHADVHQDDRDLVLEQVLQRFLAGRRLDEVLAELAKDHLIGRAASRTGRRPAGC